MFQAVTALYKEHAYFGMKFHLNLLLLSMLVRNSRD